MRLATSDQSREIDEISQKAYGLTGDILMESAGALAAREIYQSFFPELSRGTMGVICGPGNNGGDGLVVARHMHSMGYRDLLVFLVAPKEQYSSLFELQYQRSIKQGLKIIDLVVSSEKIDQIKSCELVVDAIFGIGLSKKVEGLFQKTFDIINSIKAPVVSLDTPSGLDCNTGVVEGSVVKADMTITFGLAKPGFFVSDGPEFVGKLRILPIGFPFEALRGVATTHFLFNEKLARRYLRGRKNMTNKSDYGHLLLVAGKQGMWGAGALAALSAYRMGTGYVTWTSFETPTQSLQEAPEVLTANINDLALWNEKKYTAMAVGPGLGVSQDTADLISKMKEQKVEVAVLDADAITTCVQYNLFPLPPNWVLTPHTGELSRIIKEDVRKIEQNRFAAALKGAEITGCHLLLKGYRTLIAYENRCMVINSGNSALAKAGTGDVLTGMIGSLLAQGHDTLQASATAAYIHGRMADEWVRIGNDKSSLTASDLKDHLPSLMSRLAGGTLV
ncbi:MAG: NAD(P)H-hydrate dehydratase [Bdellovibrionaceae bacterium]|nr:NAD(P)H-hydrate dehydratase [Pseudobdellovibrionaceae bacterium]